MLILGIESSCDETAAAVVESGRTVRSNVIASQDALHEEYGGVVPEIASRAHLERLVPTIERALREAGCAAGDLSAVAVGHRPGLIGSLLVGVAAAKALAWSLDLPLLGIDHVQAHLYAGALDAELPAFPALGLVVSGGHTHLYRCLSPIEIACIGSTIDDAVGEAYDKVGAMLGLPYPGGPRVDALAHTLPASEPLAHDFPVSRLEPTSLDFSFSGLKTAVLYAIRGVPEQTPAGPRFPRELADLTDDERAQIAGSFQRAACRAITIKVQRAARAAEVPYRSLLVGGGVSANKRLRAELTNLAADEDLDIRLPHIRYCLDNAAMIAGLAHHRLAAGQTDDLSLRAAPSSALSPA